MTATSTHPAAQDFVSFLAGDAGRGHFEKEGFSILTGDASN